MATTKAKKTVTKSKTAKKLLIMESPSKANTVKKYLGSGYNVVASMGHIIDLPKSQLGVDVKNNFEPKYITIRGKGELLSMLKKEAKAASTVYLATDPDREGEAISWHLARALDIDPSSACRITFNSVTKDAVKKALTQPRAIDMDLVDAQQARRVLDRLVGYSISPLLWEKVKKGLSAGRVQSVATRMICDRDEEIASFIPKEYWTITADLTEPNKKKSFSAKFCGIDGKEKELLNEADAMAVVNGIKGKDFIVTNIKESEKKRNPQPPFITSTLQQDAARKLGFNVQKTMQVAQTLYEGVNIPGHGLIGLITYMRTDSLRIDAAAQNDALAYIADTFGREYVSARQYKSKKSAQDAHEAIRPTYVNIVPDDVKDALSNDQYKLYKLIWSRMIASQMSPMVYSVTSASIDAGHCNFNASGSVVVFKGYSALYIEGSDDNEKEKIKSLPHLELNQKVTLNQIDPKQKFTQPPNPFTEATLIKELEDKGIGRPSTYAAIISTIIARGYVVRRQKQLHPTELGKITNTIMKQHFKDIVDIEFTANLESKLDDIEDGKRQWVDVLKEFNGPFEQNFEKAKEAISKIEIKDEVSDVICEKCGRNMVYKIGRYGKFLACPGYPACSNTKPILELSGDKCPKCGNDLVVRRARNGNKYYACIKGEECGFMTWDTPKKDETCPKCGGLLLRKFGRGAKVYCAKDNCDYERSGK